MPMNQVMIQPIRYSTALGPERAKRDSGLPEGLVLPRFGEKEGKEHRPFWKKIPPASYILLALGTSVFSMAMVKTVTFYNKNIKEPAAELARMNAPAELTEPGYALARALGLKPDSQKVTVEKLRTAFVHKNLKESARAIYLHKTTLDTDLAATLDRTAKDFYSKLLDSLEDSYPGNPPALSQMLKEALQVEDLRQLLDDPKHLKGFGEMLGLKSDKLGFDNIAQAFERLPAEKLNEIFHFE